MSVNVFASKKKRAAFYVSCPSDSLRLASTEKLFPTKYAIHKGSEYSNLLNTGQVWYMNGPQESYCK